MSIIEPMGRPTISDVARKCGVSKTTVSVILNKTPASLRVSAETQQRVKQMALQLGYRPNWRARALTSRRTHTIGVLYAPPMPIVVRGNYEGIMVGIHETLHAQGYHVLFVPLADDPAEWGPILLDQRMDGCMILSRLRDPLPALLEQGRLPAVLVNADSEHPLPSVIADDLEGARLSTQHLIDLGHRRISFLLGEQPRHYSVTQRQIGYAQTMTDAGLGQHVQLFGGTLEQWVTWLVNEPRHQRPTALLVYTHFMAVRLLQLLWDAGISVPADLSVSTFSNAFPVEWTIPPLTTVALPTEAMGQAAAEMVLEQIRTEGAAPKRRVVLQETLIIRRSTAPPGA
jgi:LacI family transcriptional regulator, galactose operon repressor